MDDIPTAWASAISRMIDSDCLEKSLVETRIQNGRTYGTEESLFLGIHWIYPNEKVGAVYEKEGLLWYKTLTLTMDSNRRQDLKYF